MKNVLITGATTGIGLSVAKRFLENEDYTVISISRDPSKKSFEHKRMFYYFGDVSKLEDLETLYAQIKEKHDKIHTLVNNAGSIIPGGIESLSFQDWDTSLTNNLSSYFNVTKTFIEMLKGAPNSSIVNVSSISAKLGGASVAYSVAKAGVNMFSQVVARELAKYNIRVNCVSPGIVNSGFQVANGVIKPDDYSNFLETQAATYPLGIGDVSEIAKAVYFLAADESSWITGANITVDGGRSVMV